MTDFECQISPILPDDSSVHFLGAKALILFKRKKPFSRFREVWGMDSTSEVVSPIVRRDGNTNLYSHWLDLIGGGREPGESPLATVVREAKEEIDLDLADHLQEGTAVILHAEQYPLKGLDGLDQGPNYPPEMNIGAFLVIYYDRGEMPSIKLGDEGEALYLMRPSELLRRDDMWPGFQMLVGRYIKDGLGIGA